MLKLTSFALGLAAMAVSVSAADDMGPAAFLWPPDRPWSADADNSAPCGTLSGPGNRTDFPLTSGVVALVDQDEGFDVQLSISHKDDPKSNDDFTVLITPASFKEIDRGHTCVHVADPPSSVKIGDKATLQIKYIADFDKPENQTFYACTDITYIDPTKFDPKTAKCFNATEPNESPSSGSDSNEPKPSKGHKGLSGGAIAGVVIGALAGAGLLAAAAVLLYRRNQQKQRLQRQQHSERAVKWDEQPGRESDSNRSVRLKNLGQAS